MIPIFLGTLGAIHPFVPVNQAEGYQKLIKLLEKIWLTITGFAATSLQPNSGAQGEYSGLMVIRAYQKSIGQGQKYLFFSICSRNQSCFLAIAGLKVVVVKNLEDGQIDFEDLKAKAFKSIKIIYLLS